MGLPIPAAGCVVATFVMAGFKPTGLWFPAMVAIFAYLMVSTVKYPDFKGKEGEKIRPIPAVIALLLGGYIIFLSFKAIIFAGFFTYAVLGILNTIFGIFDSKPTP
jgi:CDP-diacylglycerol--serine O-phosphatidyltransferase